MKRFLTGLTTGLAVNYLTSPRSGKQTRDQLVYPADQQTKEHRNKTISWKRDWMGAQLLPAEKPTKGLTSK